MSFRVKHYEIKSEKIRADLIRIVFLSDLHLTEHGAGNKKLISKIDELRPDVVLVGGDMVIGKENHSVDVAEGLLRTLAENYSVYCALGNHELRMKNKTERFGQMYQGYYDKLVAGGIHILDNSSEEFMIGKDAFCVWGLSLPLNNYKRFARHELSDDTVKKYLGMADKEKYNILLAHHPRFAQSYFDWGADLILSGHIHGGVMRLGKRAVISPDFQVFPKYGYGHFQEQEKHMLISGGLGEHTVPFRIFNPKELLCIDIYK